MRRTTVVVIGLGNIGSHLVGHLARLVGVARIVLVDPDAYDDANRQGQAIEIADVGRSKVDVQAERIRRINPALRVDTWPVRVEAVPLGHLRGDVLLTCLDSRMPRQYTNEAARGLGLRWVDAGVEPDGWLARVTVYEPGCETPCYECALDARHYESAPQTYECDSMDTPDTLATGAPSSLGGLAGSLQALECQKLLEGGRGRAALGTEVVVDGRSHTLYRSALRRNPTCRLPHHAPFTVEPVPWEVSELTLADLRSGSAGAPVSQVRVPFHTWAGPTDCTHCDRTPTDALLRRTTSGWREPCPGCGAPLTVSGFECADELTLTRLSPTALARPLADYGLRVGDVLALGHDDRTRHVEIVGRSSQEEHQ